MSVRIQNVDYPEKARQLFASAAFVRDVGIGLAQIGDGWCDASLEVQPRHGQQDRFVHAGVMATMADHTAGAAAITVLRADETILTVEFKINLLRPALGTLMRCHATVLRQGRTLIICESEVFIRDTERETLVAKAMVTLAVVPVPT